MKYLEFEILENTSNSSKGTRLKGDVHITAQGKRNRTIYVRHPFTNELSVSEGDEVLFAMSGTDLFIAKNDGSRKGYTLRPYHYGGGKPNRPRGGRRKSQHLRFTNKGLMQRKTIEGGSYFVEGDPINKNGLWWYKLSKNVPMQNRNHY